jgi:hypothetical protein
MAEATTTGETHIAVCTILLIYERSQHAIEGGIAVHQIIPPDNEAVILKRLA